jgi:hypothetical protein
MPLLLMTHDGYHSVLYPFHYLKYGIRIPGISDPS